MTPRTLSVLTLAAFTASCGSESTGPRLPVATIEIVAPGNVWVGETPSLYATTRDRNGAAVTGRTIVWSSSNNVVASVDASGVLTAHSVGTTSIAASSEGTQSAMDVVVSDLDILYEGFLGGFSEMLVLRLGGGQPSRVLPPGALVTGPVPSPDGRMIAFVATEVAANGSDIYVVNRDGTGLAKITSTAGDDDNPSWSPDGTKIAFRSLRGGRFGDIWVMDADGGNAVNLTPDPVPDTRDDRRPAWSPDGTRIAFSSNRAGTYDIWIMGADGSDPVALSSTRDYDTEPTWSPDGIRLAFRRSDDNTSDIMVVFAVGGFARRLSLPGHELMPAWSPKGDVIAFAYFAPFTTGPQIYTMRPEGSGLTLRTTEPAWNGGIEPRWVKR
jgi:Tol biopolymer transport system component